MQEGKKFDKAGDTEEKTIWNKSGTRLWRMSYTLVEVRPSWRKTEAQNAEQERTNEDSAASAKPKTKTAAKSKPQKPSRSKKKQRE